MQCSDQTMMTALSGICRRRPIVASSKRAPVPGLTRLREPVKLGTREIMACAPFVNGSDLD